MKSWLHINIFFCCWKVGRHINIKKSWKSSSLIWSNTVHVSVCWLLLLRRNHTTISNILKHFKNHFFLFKSQFFLLQIFQHIAQSHNLFKYVQTFLQSAEMFYFSMTISIFYLILSSDTSAALLLNCYSRIVLLGRFSEGSFDFLSHVLLLLLLLVLQSLYSLKFRYRRSMVSENRNFDLIKKQFSKQTCALFSSSIVWNSR